MQSAQNQLEVVKKKINDSKINQSSEVVLVAVSKMQPIDKIREFYSLGVRDFGENYVQELTEKNSALKAACPEIKWHLIGHLQTNKVKQAMQSANVFQALDSEKLLKTIEKFGPQCGWTAENPWPVYIQLNFDDESTKSGILRSDFKTLLESAKNSPIVRVEGVMSIPRPAQNEEQAYKVFTEIKDFVLSYDKNLKLSLGMSDDYAAAVRAGSSMVRVGRTLFGERNSSLQNPSKKMG